MYRELSAPSDLEKVRPPWDLQELLTALVRAAGSQTPGGTPFVVLKDSSSGLFNGVYPPTSPAASYLRGAQLEARLGPGGRLRDLLERGEAVVLNGGEERRALPDPGRSFDGPTLLIFPLVFRSELVAFLCIASAAGEERPSSGAIELLETLCRETAPVFARLWQAETPESRGGEHAAEPGPLIDLKVEGAEVENQLRAHLLQNIAHELRTPLTAMRGYTRMMLEGRSGDLNDTQREYLSIVAENIQRLLGLTQNLLRLTSIPSLQLEPIDLCELWSECSLRARSAAREKRVVIQERIPDGPLAIQGDRQKLVQVLDSLLGAVLRGTGQNGEIRVELSRGVDEAATVQISASGPDSFAGDVRDSAGAAPVRDSEAALAAVRDVVFLHGGRISMASRIGEGSKFVLTLPAIHG